MGIKTLLRRIEQAEQSVRSRSKLDIGCICFPGPAPPRFLYSSLQKIAFQVKCPCHGDRFAYFPYLYVAHRFREQEINLIWPSQSEQYRKAWNASFPSALWTQEEMLIGERKWFLPKEVAESREIMELVRNT